jgi:hypothetical protein
MTIPRFHFFRSGAEADLFGFTTDETGEILPERFRPWQLLEHNLHANGDPIVTVGFAEVAIARRDGFCLVRGGISAQRHERPN